MRLSITNFRRVVRAEMQLSHITLVAARNGDGKTSALQAAGCALSGSVIPVEELTKSNADLLVNTDSGATQGEVIVESPEGRIRLTYPEAKRATTDKPVEINPHAAGLVSILDEKSEDRSRLLSKLLGAEPTEADLSAEIAKIGYGAELTAKIWQTVQALGWDAAHKASTDKGTKFKGEWRGVTGETHGSVKGGTWVPKEWEMDLSTKTTEELAGIVNAETEWLEAAISDSAVANADIEKLRASAGQLTEHTSAAANLKIQLDAIYKNENDIRAALAKLPPAEQPKTVACPHCQGALAVSGGTVSAATVLGDQEIAQRAEAIAACKTTLEEVSAELRRVSLDHARESAAAAASKEADEALKKIAARPVTPGGTASVEDCRKRVARGQARCDARQKWLLAKALHEKILQNAKISAVLAGDGLRLTKLMAALAGFNAVLSEVCAAAGWDTVSIRENMGVFYGAWPYALSSKSRKYRCRVALQLAIAKADGSPIVIIDEADILDDVGRNGLFGMLSGMSEKMFLVGMTMKPEAVPNLSGIGGVAYYIENGEARLCQ